MALTNKKDRVPKPKGKEVLASVRELMSKQPKLLVLPLVAGICAVIAFLIIVLPVGLIGAAAIPESQSATQAIFAVVVLWISLFAATSAAVFFQVSLVFGINAIMDGETPSVGWCIAQARTRIGKILSWAALAATVGVVLRVLTSLATGSDNPWVAILGWIVRIVGATAWALASFFIVPLIVVKNVSPITGLKESTKIVKSTFGTTMRSVVRFGLIEIGCTLIAVAVIAAGIGVIALGSAISGAILLVIGIIGLIVVSCVFTAYRAALNAVLYRYSETQELPAVGTQGFKEVSDYLEATGSNPR